MKFPSLSQLWLSTSKVILRFPIPILFTALATICAYVLSYQTKDLSLEQNLIKGIYLGNLGLAFSLAFALFSEAKALKGISKWLGHTLVFAIIIPIYFWLNPFDKQVDIVVLLIIAFAFHLMVAISAFISKEENNGFWQMNKSFFIHFATAVLYSAVLFAGLSIALLSIQTLFDIKWEGEVYLRLWIIIVGLFNTLFFLSGITQPLKQLSEEKSYPKGLKVFTQYVLIPLTSIYLLILLVYEVKILLAWSLPESSVAILILGYAVFGILSLLLVHPLQHLEENKWIKWYSKSFYLLMLPLIILLVFSIQKRVADYGITESRYVIIALTVWLIFITVYFLIKGREQIRMIPISLCVISLFIILGPWGIKAVSKNSQQERLASFLSKKPTPKRNNEVRDITRYLVQHHGVLSLQSFIKDDVLAVERQFKNKYEKEEYSAYKIKSETQDSLLRLLKVNPEYEITEDNGLLISQERKFDNQDKGILDIKGAIKIVEFNSNMNIQDKIGTPFNVDKEQFIVTIDSTSRINVSAKSGEKITFNSNEMLKKLLSHKEFKSQKTDIERFDVPNSLMSIQQNLKDYTFVCRFERINGGYKTNAKKEISNIYFNGFIIIYPKK
jgi:hypothetical protein